MTFDMSEAWRDATSMIRANRDVLTVVAGIFFFLPSLVTGLALPDIEAVAADPDALQAQMMAFYAEWAWMLIPIILVQTVGYLAMLALLRDRSRPTVGQAITIGARGLLPAIGSYALLVAAMTVVTLALVIPAVLLAGAQGGQLVVFGPLLVLAIYASVKLSLAAPIIAIDHIRNPLTVLRRSWRLTKGNSFRLFAFYVLLALVYFVIAMVFGMFVSAVSLLLGESIGSFVNAIAMGLIGAAATVVFVAVLAAAHRQLAATSA